MVQKLHETPVGGEVEGIFILNSCTDAKTKNGKPYIQGEIMNAEGRMHFKKWDWVDTTEHREAKFVAIKGKIDEYNGQKQVIAEHLLPVVKENVDLSLLIPGLSKDKREELYAELTDIVDNLEKPYSDICWHFIETYKEAILVIPAGIKNHHAKLGGWLEHVVSMAKAAKKLADHYKTLMDIDSSLLQAGAVLHDAGKVQELEVTSGLGYTEEGNWFGHIHLGMEIIAEALEAKKIPHSESVQKLKHLVLSHHGRTEYGSPINPKIPEAQMLHQIDMMDAALEVYRTVQNQESTEWSTWCKGWQGVIYLGKKKESTGL